MQTRPSTSKPLRRTGGRRRSANNRRERLPPAGYPCGWREASVRRGTGRNGPTAKQACVGSASPHGYTGLDRQLDVPTERRTDDAYAARHTQCGISPELTIKTKPGLVQEMVAAVVKAQSLRSRGDHPSFLNELAGLGPWYDVEVHIRHGFGENVRPHTSRHGVAEDAAHSGST